MLRARLLAALAVLALLGTACGDAAEPVAGTDPEPEPVEEPAEADAPDEAPDDEGPDADAEAYEAGEVPDEDAAVGADPGIVAVNAPITDLVAQVTGDRAEVTALMPEGADHHTYEPSPGDATRLAEADLFFANGLDLNPDVIRLAEANLGDGDVPFVLLGEEAVPEQHVIRDDDHHHGDEDPGHTHEANPHVWMNPEFAEAMVFVIEETLVDADPDGEEIYRENAAAYREELAAVDEAIAEAVATIPESHRNVVTFHDSWDYFLPHYGLEPVAAVQPSDYSDPSASEVRDIIDQIRAEDVPAVFGSEQFPSGVLDAIAEETGATYHGDLSDEQLPGQPGDPEHSYLGLMVDSARTIVDALEGDSAPLDAVDPAR